MAEAFEAQAAQIYEYLHMKCVHTLKAHSDIPDYEPCITCAETFIKTSLTTAHQQGRAEERERIALLCETKLIKHGQEPTEVLWELAAIIRQGPGA